MNGAENPLEELRQEFDKFQKPSIPSGTQVTEENASQVLADIHTAVFGNGDPGSGVLWTLAEHKVELRHMKEQHCTFRKTVTDHMQEDKKEAIEKDRSITAFVRRYPKTSIVIVSLAIVGLSSVGSIIMQQRQANRLENIVAEAISERLGLNKPLHVPSKKP